MKRVFFGILALFLPFNARAAFVKVEGIDAVRFKKVIVSPADENIFYAVTYSSLFRTGDGGLNWEKIFSSVSGEINDICADRYMSGTVYVATGDSVWKVSRGGTDKVFSLPPEVNSVCIAKCRENVYLGTSQGVYGAVEDLWKWEKVTGIPGEDTVYSLACGEKDIYAAADSGVFYFNDAQTGFRKVSVLKEIYEAEGGTEVDSEDISFVLKKDMFNPETVYLGTPSGLFVSYDRGRSFVRFMAPVVETAQVRTIIQSELSGSYVYVATDKGVFRLDPEALSSAAVFEGLPVRDVFWIEFDMSGQLLAATAMGLYRNREFTLSCSAELLTRIINSEPPVMEIQQAALKYNEVHPDKIRRWRRALKCRGFLPEVSLSYDKTIYGTAGGSTYEGKTYVGPYDWGIKFSWDAGDIIWNSYEDDIDNRSRLTTQLRINLLDDINSLYFQRIRLKLELMDRSLPEEDFISKKLRIEELTAALDGYTGGYFSRSRQRSPIHSN